MLMLYFSVTFCKLRFAKNTLHVLQGYRITWSRGDFTWSDSSSPPQNPAVLSLCSHLMWSPLIISAMADVHCVPRGGRHDGAQGCWASWGGVDVCLLHDSCFRGKSWHTRSCWATLHCLWWGLFQIMFLIEVFVHTPGLSFLPLLSWHTEEAGTW